MPCLLTLIALITPRLVIALLWLFTAWFAVVPSGIWILLGFIFLPTTLLWYAAVQHWFGGEWSFFALVGVAIALAIDVSPASGRKKS
jgi:hypothetical protein